MESDRASIQLKFIAVTCESCMAIPVERIVEWIIFAACLCLDSNNFPKSIIEIWIYTDTFTKSPPIQNVHATKLQNITQILSERITHSVATMWQRVWWVKMIQNYLQNQRFIWKSWIFELIWNLVWWNCVMLTSMIFF